MGGKEFIKYFKGGYFMNKIAFIGVGVMGKPMVQHLTSAG